MFMRESALASSKRWLQIVLFPADLVKVKNRGYFPKSKSNFIFHARVALFTSVS
jgi:hypothetical protein